MPIDAIRTSSVVTARRRPLSPLTLPFLISRPPPPPLPLQACRPAERRMSQSITPPFPIDFFSQVACGNCHTMLQVTVRQADTPGPPAAAAAQPPQHQHWAGSDDAGGGGYHGGYHSGAQQVCPRSRFRPRFPLNPLASV